MMIMMKLLHLDWPKLRGPKREKEIQLFWRTNFRISDRSNNNNRQTKVVVIIFLLLGMDYIGALPIEQERELLRILRDPTLRDLRFGKLINKPPYVDNEGEYFFGEPGSSLRRIVQNRRRYLKARGEVDTSA
jgi:hypothetical protein